MKSHQPAELGDILVAPIIGANGSGGVLLSVRAEKNHMGGSGVVTVALDRKGVEDLRMRLAFFVDAAERMARK